MTTKTKVEKTKDLHEDMRSWILRGQYLRGSRLPTEAELSSRYELSRSAVREVVAQLKAEGLVASRQGSGLFVVARPTTALDAPNFVNNFSDMIALFDFRMLIETESAALAASKRSESDIERIEAKSRNLQEVFRNGGQGTQEDFDFHLQIAKTSGNKFLLSSILALQTGVIFSAKLGQKTSDLPRFLQSKQVTQEHAAIIEAIRAADGTQARAAMQAHIEASLSRILHGQP
ncbi:FadR/GntR family transcriptional regulator [Vreelandella zhanjiangensis]|uniref:FadR/GntR family transcriptional regulator n=1 Tax=Vreelandella zhanjiangensis TaxID=1121960 RepID=UPI00402A7C03